MAAAGPSSHFTAARRTQAPRRPARRHRNSRRPLAPGPLALGTGRAGAALASSPSAGALALSVGRGLAHAFDRRLERLAEPAAIRSARTARISPDHNPHLALPDVPLLSGDGLPGQSVCPRWDFDP